MFQIRQKPGEQTGLGLRHCPLFLKRSEVKVYFEGLNFI